MMSAGLKKSERLCSKLIIDKLFAGGNMSMATFPLRIVYMRIEKANDCRLRNAADMGLADTLPPVSILVSVPKKRFHHATDRNRMKRLIREAYRLNKHILWEALEEKDYRLAVAFVCITDTLPTFHTVNKSMKKALVRMAEKEL